jgi:aldose 1-epimerase
VRPVVASAQDFADNPRSPGRNGTPVLFPFPNRIRDGRFSFAGKSYQLPANNGPNAIHGFAIDADWDVVEQGANDQEAFVTGQYQISKQSPDRTSQWPADAIIRMRYALAGRRVTLDVTVTNPSAQDLPFGFGIHPYFFDPLDPAGDPKQTSVVIPASEYWVLKEFLPTGERKPVDARLDFRKGQPMAGLKLDDVLTGLGFEGDRCTCRLGDHTLKAEFRLSFDRSFREIVLYTPPGETRVIAVEPYTQTTDAINLQARGIEAGLRVLHHDEQARMTIVMETAG